MLAATADMKRREYEERSYLCVGSREKSPYPEGQASHAAVAAMCAAQIHRGPDSDGFHVENEAVLGARRLAIIDVATATSPLFGRSLHRGCPQRRDLQLCGATLSAKGAWPSVRDAIGHRGHRAVVRRARADTRSGAQRNVCIRPLGHACTEADLARDRVGRNPSTTAIREITSASPLNSLHCSQGPRYRAPRTHRRLTYSSRWDTCPNRYRQSKVFASCHLPPFSSGKVAAPQSNATGSLFEPKEAGTREEIDRADPSTPRDAVQVRLISERPLGAFLSGGIDSGAVVATMAELSRRPVKTFTIGFTTESFNELPHARRVAELYGTDHSEFIVEPKALAVLPKLIRHYSNSSRRPISNPLVSMLLRSPRNG